jgi:serine/threonine protein kinase
MTLVLGSPLYMAPELIKREVYSEKIDVWSLGVITYQLLSGKTPFESRSIKKIDFNICNKDVKFLNSTQENWSDISGEAKDFINQCLNRDQISRPSVKELFEHPWITNYLDQKFNQPIGHSSEITYSIQKNLIKHRELN